MLVQQVEQTKTCVQHPVRENCIFVDLHECLSDTVCISLQIMMSVVGKGGETDLAVAVLEDPPSHIFPKK